MAENGKVYFDILGPFPDGMNSGVQPLLLPKTQLAFATNATVRGAYIHDRPPYQIRNLDFGASGSLQTEVENGFFQGAGVYRPDYGPSQIIAQINGRLYSFTENGPVFVVQDITIPGDANDATTSQVWMWQSEKWLIISDGSGKLPIFYDGVSCRRSLGPSRILGTAVAFNPPTVPAAGQTVEVTLNSAYTGPSNISVRFNNAIYELVGTTPAATLYNAELTYVYGSGPTNSGSTIVVNPNNVGYIASGSGNTVYFFGGAIPPLTFEFRAPHGLTAGQQVLVDTVFVSSGAPPVPTERSPQLYNVIAIVDSTHATLQVVGFSWGYFLQAAAIPGDAFVQFAIPVGPNVVIATLAADLATPFPGVTQTITTTNQYTGSANQSCWLGQAQYLISPYTNPSPPPPTVLTLINGTDTAGGVYVNPSNITSIPELPACRMGAYGMGQNWVCLVDGIEFMVSDLVGSSAGTLAYNFRDAVLKTTDNEIMGNFRLPNAGFIINSMTFAAQLDVSLGQGALEIGTMVNMFSCKAPFTLLDFQATIVQPMQNPILTESLIGTGPLGQNSTVLANSDTMFRSTVGLGSLKIARRDISDDWGNTPISREMSRVIDRDNNSPLLSYSSAIVFDNRLRFTVSPVVAPQGVYHEGEIALNFDLVSSLRGKAPPVYDGLWTGLNVLQHLTGMFNTIQRSFAFTYNITLSKLELYELLSDPTLHKDNGVTPIVWTFETPVIFNQDVKPLPEIVRLIDGEIYISDLQDTAHFKVQYRPVFYPCWIDWTEFDVCADMTKEHSEPQVTYPLGLGEPSAKDCDTINNRPFREAVGFQLRFEITGHCIFWGAKIAACSTPQPKWAKPACNR